MRRQTRLGFVAVLAVAILVPSLAEAQTAWLSDRTRTEGPGFRLGDFELHPGVGVEVGYNSNLYYAPDNSPFGVVDTGVLRATAHLLFSTRGQQRRTEGEAGGGQGAGGPPAQPTVSFRGGVDGSFYYFFAAPDRTNMEVDASLALTILPGRPFSIDLYEEFGRSIRPFTDNSSMFASFARDQNAAGVNFNFATSGDVLRISAGYRFGLNFFESPLFQYGNNFQHTVTVNETFRFLPQTAIVQDNNFTVLNWFSRSAAPTTQPLVNDGYLLRTRVGLNGAFTSNFSVLGVIGYAAGFYNTTVAGYDMEYESLVAQVEARWQIEQATRLVFGYDRDFKPSFIGNFYRRDRGYINFQTILVGAFLIGAEVSLGLYDFGAIVRSDGMMLGNSLTRQDVRFIGQLFAEYRFTEWLGVNATLNYTGNFTDFAYFVPVGGMAPIIDPAQFNQVQVFGGVRVFY